MRYTEHEERSVPRFPNAFCCAGNKLNQTTAFHLSVELDVTLTGSKLKDTQVPELVRL